jgi:hypothetical protein
MADRVRRVAVQLERAAARRRVFINLREPARARVFQLEMFVAVVHELVAAEIRLADSITGARTCVDRQPSAILEVIGEHAIATHDIRIEVRSLLEYRWKRSSRGAQRVRIRRHVGVVVRRLIFTVDFVAPLSVRRHACVAALRVEEVARATRDFERVAGERLRILCRERDHAVRRIGSVQRRPGARKNFDARDVHFRDRRQRSGRKAGFGQRRDAPVFRLQHSRIER